jgi:hypothetical protein
MPYKDKEKLKQYQKEYREKNKEKLKEYQKEYTETNKDKLLEKSKIWYENNKEKKKEYDKSHREENRETINEQRKKYYEENKETINEQKRNYYEKNKEKINKQISINSKSVNALTIKLRNCKNADKEKKRDFDIDEQFIKELLEKQNNICNHCKTQVKIEWEDNKDPLQFSINRLVNSIGHIKVNVEITCWGCNNKLNNQGMFKRGSIFKRNRENKNKNGINSYWDFKYSLNGETKTKSFSVNKYGEEEAKKLCIEYQNKIFPLNN